MDIHVEASHGVDRLMWILMDTASPLVLILAGLADHAWLVIHHAPCIPLHYMYMYL